MSRILEDLGRRVQQKRGDQGIRAAAKEIGISHATLSRIERGYLPDLENYQKICRWLGDELKVAAVTAASSAVKPIEVNFRKPPTTSAESAQALARMILAAQALLPKPGGTA